MGLLSMSWRVVIVGAAVVVGSLGTRGEAWAASESARSAVHGKTLVATHQVPEAVLKKFAKHQASKPVQGESAVVNAMLADTEDWVAPEMPTSSSANPYTLVIVVKGRAQADGDVTSLWHAGWRFDDGGTRLMPVAGMVTSKARAGAVVTLVGKAPISFKEDRTLAPAIGLAKAQNLTIDEVTVQVWSGLPGSSFKDLVLSFNGLLVGVVMLGLIWWFRRR